MKDTYVLQKAFDETAKYLVFLHESKMQERKKMQKPIADSEEFNSSLKKYSLFEILELSAKENLKAIIDRLLWENATIIITKKEQLVALTILLAEERRNDYKIINLDEKYLKAFPENDAFCKSFYKAYCTENQEEIVSLYIRYLT